MTEIDCTDGLAVLRRIAQIDRLADERLATIKKMHDEADAESAERRQLERVAALYLTTEHVGVEVSVYNGYGTDSYAVWRDGDEVISTQVISGYSLPTPTPEDLAAALAGPSNGKPLLTTQDALINAMADAFGLDDDADILRRCVIGPNLTGDAQRTAWGAVRPRFAPEVP
jgi:hypothetical protein